MRQRVIPHFLTGTFIVGCLLVAMLPLVILSFYNHPSPADDYCFAYTARTYGYWHAQVMYYNGWSGRYFQNLIVHANPLYWNWREGYYLQPLLVLLFLWWSFYVLSQRLGRAIFPSVSQAVIASGGAALFLMLLVTVSEFFYWNSGMATYGLSCAMIVLLLGVLITHERQNFRFTGQWFAAAFLVQAIIGCSETSMIMVLSLLAMIVLCLLLYRRQLPVSYVALLVLAAICTVVSLKAPGNTVRMSGNPNSGNFLLSFTGTLTYSLDYFPKLLLRTPLLPFSLLYIPVAYQLTDDNSPAHRYFMVHPALALLHTAASVFVLTFLHFWGVGIAPVPRLMNVVNMVFMLGWFYNLTVWVRALRPGVERWAWLSSFSLPLLLIAGLGTVLTMYHNPMLRMTYGDLRSGAAQKYDEAMTERYHLMTTGRADTVALAPLPASPPSLVSDDIRDNPQHLWNKCWASYFYRNGVKLQPLTPSRDTAGLQTSPKL